jgi:hypothetical protein
LTIINLHPPWTKTNRDLPHSQDLLSDARVHDFETAIHQSNGLSSRFDPKPFERPTANIANISCQKSSVKGHLKSDEFPKFLKVAFNFFRLLHTKRLVTRPKTKATWDALWSTNSGVNSLRRLGVKCAETLLQISALPVVELPIDDLPGNSTFHDGSGISKDTSALNCHHNC